jgi:predicted small integral membrane protein
MDNVKGARIFIGIGRLSSFLAFLALVGAWITQLTDRTLLGMTQQHRFNDAIVLSLLGIVGLLDGVLHSKNL